MRNRIIMITLILVILLFLLISLRPAKINGFYEEFIADSETEKRNTEFATQPGAVVPVRKGEFTFGSVKSKDGMLCLSTGDHENTGGGEWRREMDTTVSPDTSLVWQWVAYDIEDFQFWVKIKFSNNRAIYYTAGGSKPPGQYQGEAFHPYKGETFRDKEGRMRFYPSVAIIVNPPQTQWSECRRTISLDYSSTYGDMPFQLSIREIVIGMYDDSTAKINELGIEYIKIDKNSTN